MDYGTLYLIPCPISDETAPWDVLPAANRDVMNSLDYFIVENTRSARRFLSKAGVERPIGELEFRELNEHTAAGREVEELVKPWLEGRSAGVMPLVGPSSIILAVMASGLNGQSFAFNGYLPVKPPERAKAIRFFERRALTEGQSQLFIEAPYRNGKLMEQLVQTLGAETRLTVAVELTAPGGRIETRTAGEWRRRPLPELNKRPAIFIIG